MKESSTVLEKPIILVVSQILYDENKQQIDQFTSKYYE